jgi:hypothetical protein
MNMFHLDMQSSETRLDNKTQLGIVRVMLNEPDNIV